MPSDLDVEQHIRTTLHRYCHTFDSGDFAAFADLFRHGRWFMVPEPGPRAVRAWIEECVILHDGRPRTRHQVSNLLVRVDGTHEAAFRCYLDIWLCPPGQRPTLLAQARFQGTFHRHPDGWWWREHTMEADYTGDLDAHIRTGPAALSTRG